MHPFPLVVAVLVVCGFIPDFDRGPQLTFGVRQFSKHVHYQPPTSSVIPFSPTPSFRIPTGPSVGRTLIPFYYRLLFYSTAKMLRSRSMKQVGRFESVFCTAVRRQPASSLLFVSAQKISASRSYSAVVYLTCPSLINSNGK